MMGVSVSQWRFSIGTFNAISIHKKCCGTHSHSQSLFCHSLKNILMSFARTVPSRIFFGFVIILTFCFVILSLLPLCYFIYPFTRFSFVNQELGDYPMVKYIVFLISAITTLPSYILIFVRQTTSVLKCHLSPELKNWCFFILVLKFLLLISVSVEINPGPPDKQIKNLSFAVWNLDSLPRERFGKGSSH